MAGPISGEGQGNEAGVEGKGLMVGVVGSPLSSVQPLTTPFVGVKGIAGRMTPFPQQGGVPPVPVFSAGVFGESSDPSGSGVHGENNVGGTGVFGRASTGAAISGQSESGIGVQGKGGRLAGRFEGDVEVTGDIRLANADVAEDFNVVTNAEPGTVMVINDQGLLVPCDKGSDIRVVGVISGAGNYRPAIVLDRDDRAERAPIALVGKTYCKVDASYGAIRVGDLLTTSPTAGHAMRVGDPIAAFGAVIGKALRPHEEAVGLIPILIALQ